MTVHQIDSMEGYVKFLQHPARELRRLSVTSKKNSPVDVLE